MRLYDDGLIYRGKRLVNWDPVLGFSVSDLEVESEEAGTYGRSAIWRMGRRSDGCHDAARDHARETSRWRSIPTRAHLVGKEVALPLTGRRIPVITDAYVDRRFGAVR